MDNRVVIDGVVRLVEAGDKLPTCPSWPELREQMAICQLFTPEQLDQSQEYIIKKFCELRLESIGDRMANRLGQPTSNKDSSKEISSSQGSNNETGFSGSCKESETDDEGSFQPTVVAANERCGMMSVCLNGRLEGAALKYCHEEESFISLRWSQRYKLEAKDGYIRLTWKFDDDLDKTHVTNFILLEDLESDFMLGIKCTDEVFNRDTGSSPSNRSPAQTTSSFDPSSIPFEPLMAQVWVNHRLPNTEFISDVLFRLERKYRESDSLDPSQLRLPQHSGRVVSEDSRSSKSNVSSVPSHGPNVPWHAPTSPRSHSKPP